jgi:hypothetical protein
MKILHRSLALLLGCGLVIAGCARRAPHGIAERYLESYAFLSAQDRKERTYAEFLTEIPLAPEVTPAWFRQVLHHTHYELGPEQRSADGLTAEVPVRITAPDLILWERTLDAANPSGQADPARVLRSLDLGNFPKRIYDDPIFLVREHHHWRIAAGFDQRDAVVEQHHDALRKYYLEPHYDKAVAVWRQMTAALEGQAATGSRGLADQYSRELRQLEQLAEMQKDLASLSRGLNLSGVAMKMSDERSPGIFGTLRNNSGRPIDAVAITVTWYTGRGKTLKAVYTEEHPVVVMPLEFTDFERPIVPLLPGESRDFGFVTLAPPEIQQTAAPYVAIGAAASTPSWIPVPRVNTATVSKPHAAVRPAGVPNASSHDGHRP